LLKFSLYLSIRIVTRQEAKAKKKEGLLCGAQGEEKKGKKGRKGKQRKEGKIIH